MKEGWTYKKLGEVCEIIAGQSPSGKSYNDSGNGMPFYQGKKEFTNKYIGVPTTWTTEITKTSEPNDILMSVRAPVGDVNFTTQKICIGRGLAAIRPHDSIDKEYLFYYLLAAKKRITGKEGAVFPSISKKEIYDIAFSYPPMKEQQRIVSRLDAAFAYIDELKANAEKQLSEARVLFQKALTKAMEPKEGWEEKKLGDVCKSVNYGTSLPSTEKGKYKYLRMNNITIDGTLDLSNLKYIDVPEKELEKCVVRKGDLLFNRTNSPELVGKTCIFKEDEEMIIAGYIIRIRFIDSINPHFASYFINLQRKLGNLRPLIVGAVHQANISAKAIQSIDFQFPSFAEQQRIVSRLDAISAHIRELEDVLQKTIDECDALKQALLRKVFE